ncbi:hypothetical protein T01_14147 [Trichinella spiralis]|uniref:Uncharacterized protein n=1 Tax=Trichinella spiralis TaxID=6334 RepID=A0A0V1BJY8_TRISP|nr:hypothetical protein T01_14147 [Trichinella spiralis]
MNKSSKQMYIYFVCSESQYSVCAIRNILAFRFHPISKKEIVVSIIQIVHFTQRKQDQRKSNFLLVIREASLICLSEKTCSLNDTELRRCIPKLIKNPIAKAEFYPGSRLQARFRFLLSCSVNCHYCMITYLIYQGENAATNIRMRVHTQQLQLGNACRSDKVINIPEMLYLYYLSQIERTYVALVITSNTGGVVAASTAHNITTILACGCSIALTSCRA